MNRSDPADDTAKGMGWLRSSIARKPELLVLFVLVVFGAFLRLWELGSVQVPWFDEITAYYVPFVVVHGYGNHVTWGLLRATTPSTITQAYILTYSSFTGMIVPALGATSSAILIRLPAVVFGTALLVLLYALGSELFDKRVGLVAAALGTVVPWTFYWSRFAGITAPLELWPVASVYVALVAVRRKNSHLLLLSLILGGLTVYTSEAGIVAMFLVILPFWLLCSREFVSRARLGSRLRSLERSLRFYAPYIVALAVLLAPIAAYEFQPTAASHSVVGSGQLVWQNCNGVSCKFSAFFDDAGLSWSPDFFAISGGVNGAQAAGFQTHISTGGAWQWGGGFTGMLTGLGLLIYPALALLIFRWLRRTTGKDAQAGRLAILLVVAYTIVGGVVYFDNPNAPRLAFAAGFFVLFIAWFMVEAIEWVFSHVHPAVVRKLDRKGRSENPAPPTPHARVLAVAIGVALLVTPVGAAYISDYFEQFPTISANYFYPQIEKVGELLSADNLWSFPLVVQCPRNLTYILPAELAFYDPVKPPSLGASVFNGSIAANVDQLNSTPTGSVFVSMVNASASTLAHAGVPAIFISESAGISLFWIPPSSRSHTTMDSIASWTRAPIQNVSSSDVEWTIQRSPTGGTARPAFVSQGYSVTAQLPANSSPSVWQVSGLLPVPLSLPSFNFVSVDWSFLSSNSGDAAALFPLYSDDVGPAIGNQSLVLPQVGAHALVYPETLLNVAPPTDQPNSLVGFLINGSLSPGASVTLLLKNFTIYGVAPVASPPCGSSPVVLMGSEWDVAIPTEQGLWYNGFNSTLRVSLCVPEALPENTSPSYVALSVRFLTYLVTPLTLSTETPSYVGVTVSGVDSPAGTSATVYAELSGGEVAAGGVITIFISFSGQLIVQGLSLLTLSPSSPPVG